MTQIKFVMGCKLGHLFIFTALSDWRLLCAGHTFHPLARLPDCELLFILSSVSLYIYIYVHILYKCMYVCVRVKRETYSCKLQHLCIAKVWSEADGQGMLGEIKTF